MEKIQYPKLIDDIPEPDIAISMGCNVKCPFIGRPFDDNWGLEDPTGKSDNEATFPHFSSSWVSFISILRTLDKRRRIFR